ncbi:HAMP domain-containing histidine kinase [Ruminococcus sp. OA3]|uniref:sensor histidine kinase n=1 Tax=Ruminococcus sp. OA3 TaxID=2914164 RepID=UPI001F0623A9|nr:HAMP domain-containing sensor histidine kinase [Ruminococcus sp. OA3]MCH1981820.1 HAMP domain-containing histidine kinase [Ruminococcus sp. OA3]
MKILKKMSVKMKITLWYACFVTAIAVFALGVVALLSESLLRSDAESELIESVRDFAEDADDDDDISEYYDNGIYFSIYDTGGRLTGGSVPAGFPLDTTLRNTKIQNISSEGNHWMTYDLALTSGTDVVCWIRGVTSLRTLSQMNTILIRLLFIMCPLLAVLAIVSGYFVTGKALKPVEEALENEKRFTADASHELRTPAAVIMAQCEYALLPETDREEVDECVKVILGQSRKMSSLISQLLMLARQDAGKEKLQLETVDIGMLTELVVRELKDRAARKDISLETDLQENLTMSGDQNLLMRMMVNLIENSIQYGRQGGTTWITLRKTGNHVEGCVRDNGIGIAREHHKDIWKRFYREDKTRKGTDESHSGLGLSMVKWIVEAHHGSIEVTSQKGKGAVFSFRLPL